MAVFVEQFSSSRTLNQSDILHFDSIAQSDSRVVTFGGVEGYIRNACNEFAREATGAFCVRAIVQRYERRTEIVRKTIFGRTRGRHSHLRPGLMYRVANLVHETAVGVERLRAEIEQDRWAIAIDRRYLNSFIRIIKRHPYPEVDRFGTVFVDHVERRVKRLDQYLSILKSWQHDRLQSANVILMFWLQVTAIIISLTALIISLLIILR